MGLVIPNFGPALPEIVLTALICVVLVVDLFLSDKNRQLTYLLTQVSLLVSAYLSVRVFYDEPVTTFDGLYVSDPIGALLKFLICATTVLVLLYCRRYIEERKLFKGEFFLLALFGVLGMLIIVSANHFLVLYLGLELLSLSLYALVGVDRDNLKSAEAAMKYFFLGAVASGALLYGMSLIYGVTGSLNVNEVAVAISQSASDEGQVDLVMALGLIFVVVALAFKLGLVPFHMWLPDIYEGSKTSVAAYIGTVTKLVAFALVLRILIISFEPMQVQWTGMLTVLAVLSIVVGNVIAIAQSNIKRMLAYSTISHMGFFSLGLINGTEMGFGSSLFYMVTYVLMSLGAFGVILLMAQRGHEAENIADFSGLHAKSPWFAFVMLMFMLSMAGVPPFVGFYAKWLVIQSVVQADMVWLALVAVVFSVVGAYYYLRVIKVMYFDEVGDERLCAAGPFDFKFVLSLNGVAVLVLGVIPGPLADLCMTVMQ